MTYIFDSNILIYLAFQSEPEHTTTRSVADKVLAAQEIVISTEAFVFSFLRITTALKSTPLTGKNKRKHFLKHCSIVLIFNCSRQAFDISIDLTTSFCKGKIKSNLDAHVAEVVLFTNSTIIANDDYKKFPASKIY